jgi:hypothetical protein
MVRVKRYEDRVSVSFADEGSDVDWIVTVTFDNRAVAGKGDEEVFTAAQARLLAGDWAYYSLAQPASPG